MVAETGVTTGQVVLMVKGSTGALTTLEFEPGLVNHDIAAAMERIAPRDGRYHHEETWHDDNGHSHVRASLVGPSLALPVADGSIPPGHLAADRLRGLRHPAPPANHPCERHRFVVAKFAFQAPAPQSESLNLPAACAHSHRGKDHV